MRYFDNAEAQQIPAGSVLLSARQRVGDGFGCFMVRDLWQAPNGDRFSVVVQSWKWCERPPKTQHLRAC